MSVAETTTREAGEDFIRDIVRADLASGRHKSVVTRFPPEPNGYLHIGHAKSICLNFGIAQEFGGQCNLRFDDTNPTKEEQEYIDAIEADVRWLGFDWGKNLHYASDYFEQLYDWAEVLIRAGKAYVDDQNPDAMRAARGTLTEPGKNSPFRERGVEENLDLFRRMRAGEFANGARVLRAKIDMASGNINLRDPVMYRILHAEHPRTGKKWSIYPSYDFAHGQSDAIEGITHSICTLEFEDHRPLYDWFLANLPVPSHPHQYEFARLNLTHTVLSKRVLTELVRGGYVSGWDDPRMPTLAGLRRRGVPPEAIRDFVKRIGVAKANSVVDMGDARLLHPRAFEQDRRTPHGGAAAAQSGDRELSGRAKRRARGAQSSGQSRGRHAAPAFFPRAFHRARRFHGKSAEEILPAVARRRGAAALRLFHHLPRIRERCRRRSGRAALHLRSRHQRRQRARRPQGQGDAALAVGGRRLAGGGAALQSAVHAAVAGDRQFRRRNQSELAGGDRRRARRAGIGRNEVLAPPCSSNARAISAPTRIRRRERLVFNRTVGLRDTWAKVSAGG